MAVIGLNRVALPVIGLELHERQSAEGEQERPAE
jgi:hypothetical protein